MALRENKVDEVENDSLVDGRISLDDLDGVLGEREVGERDGVLQRRRHHLQVVGGQVQPLQLTG